jgi:hypothetical protein
MHFITCTILHHFLATYNHFFYFPRKHKNKQVLHCKKPPISMVDIKKVLNKNGECMRTHRVNSIAREGECPCVTLWPLLHCPESDTGSVRILVAGHMPQRHTGNQPLS